MDQFSHAGAGGSGQGTAGGTDIVSAIKGITQQLSALVLQGSGGGSGGGGGGGGGGPTVALVTGTLTASALSTTVTAPTCKPTSAILPCPLTQDAANDMATTSYAPGTGQFIITHASNARVDRNFVWAVIT